VTTRFQGDIGGRRPGAGTGLLQGQYFGMFLPGSSMPGLADDLAICGYDAADAGVRITAVERLHGEIQRTGHMHMVLR
jgi:hypothetical protein